jgi:hypothetical protein
MSVLAILVAEGKHNKKTRTIAKLPGASPIEMMLASHASMGKIRVKGEAQLLRETIEYQHLSHLKETMSLQSYYMICLRAFMLSRAAKVLVPPSHLALSYL